MNTLLFIFLVVGTLVVIFQKTIVDFLFQYCNFDKIMDLDNYFLSAAEKRRKREMLQLLEKSSDDLQLQAKQIIELYGKRCDGDFRISVKSEIMEKIPQEVQSFFEAYDYLLINNYKVLDVKRVEKIAIDGRIYYIIGEIPEERTIYMVADQSQTPENQRIYEQEYNIKPNKSRNIIFVEQNCYISFNNFICFAAAYFSEE